MRAAAAVVAGAAFAGQALAQNVAPPDAAALRPLNLTTVWTTAVPIDGRADGVARIQVADQNQIFVQTKRGVLIALDGTTGAQQWSQVSDAAFATIMPLAWNDRYVFAVNVVKLYAFQRTTGVVDFAYDLPTTPSSGPAADSESVYVVLGSSRLAAYDLPRPIGFPDKSLTRKGQYDSITRETERQNPANLVAARNPGSGRRGYFPEEQFESAKVTLTPDSGTAIYQRTASLSASPTVTPPFRLLDNTGKYINKTDSLSATRSLRQPYQLNDPTMRYAQRTPSISVLPPSLAALHQLTNLMPKPVEPTLRWKYGSTVRLINTPLVSGFRVWVESDTNRLLALLKTDATPQLSAQIADVPAAEAGQADDIGYFPLMDGNLLAVELSAGGGQTMRRIWRSNVGGLMNRRPAVTADAVFITGNNSGVIKVRRDTGDVVWRTESSHDSLLATNAEYAYVLDREGGLHVYPQNGSGPLRPLATARVGDFKAVTNDRTDRILLASDTGLLVCLRDASPAYVRPVTMAPLKAKPEVKKADAKPAADTTAPPPAAPEKKEAEKKEPEKKDPEKKM